MNNFDLGETVICSVEIRNESGVLVDPTLITITISDSGNAKVVDAQVMTKDGVGKYHWDYIPTVKIGTYIIKYVATDGSRFSIQKDNFTVV